jgi:hypothetical protein
VFGKKIKNEALAMSGLIILGILYFSGEAEAKNRKKKHVMFSPT